MSRATEKVYFLKRLATGRLFTLVIGIPGINSPAYAQKGQNRGSDDVDIALSIELEASNSLSIFGNLGGSFWSNGSELNYGGGLRVRW